MTFGDGNVKYQEHFQTILEENLNYLYFAGGQGLQDGLSNKIIELL